MEGLFAEEVTTLGGRVTDTVTHGRRLYARGILPRGADVAVDDRVEPGVALRYTGDEIEVRPWVLREVCRNGAVLAFSGVGCKMQHIVPGQVQERLPEVREAIRASASRETFADFVGSMRGARHEIPDFESLVMSLQLFRHFGAEALLDLMERFQAGGIRNVFAFANAITAVARDTEDPELRWRRESIGAAVFARLPKPTRANRRAEALLEPR
ncbi:MAG: hypothetical protein OER88_00725 [Planctomycetota bacterium]|nr:hypothetical protein [Planctomycetota bacterium]